MLYPFNPFFYLCYLYIFSIQSRRRRTLLVYITQRLRGCCDTWQRDRCHSEDWRWFWQIGFDKRRTQV